MTDKAAREAFEAFEAWRLSDERQDAHDPSDADAEIQAAFYAGIKHAHDAAMAAEPDARLVIVALKALDDPRVPSPTVGRDATAALDSLLLQLQAAQQRGAELRTLAKPVLDLANDCLESLGGCDHDAGICSCADERSVEELDAALATQPTNKGETT